jgi:hypothetical protein
MHDIRASTSTESDLIIGISMPSTSIFSVNAWVVLQDALQLVFSAPAWRLDKGRKSAPVNIGLAGQVDPSVAATFARAGSGAGPAGVS